MTRPRSKSRGPTPPELSQKSPPERHRPCRVCHRYGGEWTEPDESGTRHAITLPRGADYEAGQVWTCAVCLAEDLADDSQ